MQHVGVPASRAVLKARISAFDAVCCLAAPAEAFLIREQGLSNHTSSSVVLAYIATSVVASFFCIVIFDLRGIVSRFFSVRDLVRVGQASLLSVLLSVMVLFIAFRLDTIPRAVPVLHTLLLTGLLVAGRMVSRHRRRKKDATGRPTGSERHTHTIIIGANTLTRAFIHMAREVTQSHELVVGVLSPSRRLHGRRIAGCPVLGAPDLLPALLQEYAIHGLRIERVVVTDESYAPGTDNWTGASESAQEFAFDLEYLPDMLVPVFQSEKPQPRSVSIEAPGFDLLRPLYWRARRAIDVIGASTLLVLTLPLTALVCVAVLVELGYPAIFWQRRLGRGRKPIKVYKFRTLRSQFDRHGRPRSGPQIGAIGSFLRATRLDELPQLYNIAVGEMSFIGPRPLLPIDQPDDCVDKRLAVRPGLTGWAQVQGGRYLTREEKARLDIWYIENASFRLDMRVIFWTIAVVFTGDKAPEVTEAHDEFSREIATSQSASLVACPEGAAGGLETGTFPHA